MALFSLPNPTKELIISASIDQIKTASHQVISLFPKEYRLISDDPVLNTITVNVSTTNIVSQLALDMGEKLDISFQRLGEAETRVVLTVTRNVGTINQAFEAQRANTTIDTFLRLISLSIQGKLEGVVSENKLINAEIEKKGSKFVWGIVVLIIIGFIYAIIQMRTRH